MIVSFYMQIELTEDCHTGSSYNTPLESILVTTSDISFISHYFIYLHVPV